MQRCAFFGLLRSWASSETCAAKVVITWSCPCARRKTFAEDDEEARSRLVMGRLWITPSCIELYNSADNFWKGVRRRRRQNTHSMLRTNTPPHQSLGRRRCIFQKSPKETSCAFFSSFSNGGRRSRPNPADMWPMLVRLAPQLARSSHLLSKVGQRCAFRHL